MKFIENLIITETKPFHKQIAFVALLMLFIAGLEALAPWPFKLLIDNVLGMEPIKHDFLARYTIASLNDPVVIAFTVVFLYFVIGILINVFTYFKSITMKKVIKQVILEFSNSAFKGLEKFTLGFYQSQAIGDYIYRLSYDTSALGEYIEEGILPIFISSLYVLITTTVMFFINVKLTLLSLAVMPFLTVGLYFFNKRIDKAVVRSERWNSALFAFIDQSLTQLEIIQAFQQEKKIASKFNRRNRTSLNSDVKVYRLDFLLNLLVGFMIAFIYTIIIANGISDVKNNIISTGLLVVFIFYLDNLTNPIIDIIFATSVIKQTRIQISRIHQFFNRRNYLKDQGVLATIEKGDIEFSGVSVLTTTHKHILTSVSFSIPYGSFTVVLGVSGSGKTTIISLLPRLVDPNTGHITLGDKKLNDYSLQTLRDSISYVPQDILLMNDTIYNNILFGYPDATHAEVVEAAKLAEAHTFIEEHEGGYQFRVGEEGNFLSGGQRQRILLARAFLKPAKILILDEPFAYLDVITRTRIWKNLQHFSKGKTVIMVTNVLDVVKNADQAIIVEKGTVKNVVKKKDLQSKNIYITV